MSEGRTQFTTSVNELWDADYEDILSFMAAKAQETFPEDIDWLRSNPIIVTGWKLAGAVNENIVIDVDWSWDDCPQEV